MSAPIIKQGAQGEYYEVGRCKYTSTFPYEWAIDHKYFDDSIYPSGPEWCGNCREYGSINGVFVFYCANCVNIYEDIIYPKRNDELFLEDILTDEDLWKACPYMQGIPLSQIGDKPVAENQELTERELARARYWVGRAKYWDAMYDENGVSIFDEEPVKEAKFDYDYYEDCGYDDDNWISSYQLVRLPTDMRAAFDPKYQLALADFRAASREM
jgi:hypothetical protein